MGMDLYLSGHLHSYERILPLCDNDTFGEDYSGKCPVYVIEGSAGNDYYVQMED